MDVDKARNEGACFKCGEKGHFSRNCPKNKRFNVRALVQEMPEEDKKRLLWRNSRPGKKKNERIFNTLNKDCGFAEQET